MGDREASSILSHYSACLDEDDSGARAVDWMPHSQLANFLGLARVEGLGPGASVLDVGCGLAALKQFFDDVGLDVAYTGWDIHPRMVARARALRPDARVELRDILTDPPAEPFDFVLCSGALNVRVPDHERWAGALIRAMFGACRRALAFNVLSRYALVDQPWTQTDEVRWYARPEEVFAFCRRLSPFVSLRHDLRVGSFLVFVYRNRPEPAARYLAHARLGPRWSPAALAAVRFHLELGLHAELIDLLAALEPCAETHAWTGVARAAQGDAAGARASYDRALEADARCAVAQLGLGVLAIRTGDLATAIELCRAAVKAQPKNIDARECLILALARSGRMEEALAEAALIPNPARRSFNLGIVHIRGGDDARARAAFEEAIAAAPSYLAAMLALADLLERAGDGAAAASWRARARAAGP